jgi:hypothetical protein
MAFFAIYGAIVIFGKKSSLNIFRRNVFIQAFCVASLLAFILEITVSNFPHYLKYFADGECHTLEVSPQDSTIILTSDGTLAEIFVERLNGTSPDSGTKLTTKTSDGTLTKKSSAKNDSTVRDSAVILATGGALAGTSLKEKDTAEFLGGIRFKNLNRRVTSLFIAPVFDTAESIAAAIKYTDEEGTNRQIMTIRKGLPHTNYLQLQLCGKVSELKITLAGANITGASQIAINKQIPLYFSGLRIIVVSLLFFAIILFVYKPFRAKIAYLLFDYRFDPSNRKQNIIYILSVISLILFSWVCAYTSVVEDAVQPMQYNKYLVEAIIAGRAHLEAGNPEKMLKAERPYDTDWLDENKYKRGVDWMPDWVFYKGKFYCYFGVVPALMLYVPYNLITGDYLSNHGGIWVFAAISIILLARLWRFLVKKYMPDARFIFYLLSFLALFFASGWFCPLRFTRFYSIVSAAGFMFVIAGVLLLFESVENDEKPDRSKLILACACFALAVGCRPNLLFASLIVPVILWKYKLWKHIPLVAIPYMAVAIPMCVYNYVRFDSIFDFGTHYNLTNLNLAAHSLLNPIGKVINAFNISLSYLFTLNHYSFFYPYVDCIPQHTRFFWTVVHFYDKGCGMINFPIVFCLFFRNIFRKEDRSKTFYISATFLAISAVLIFVNSWMIGHSGRYTIDFAVFIILPSLFCAYYWCNGGDGGVAVQPSENRIPTRVRQKITYVLLVFSIFVGLFLFATSVTNDATPYSYALYYYLRQSLILFGIV